MASSEVSSVALFGPVIAAHVPRPWHSLPGRCHGCVAAVHPEPANIGLRPVSGAFMAVRSAVAAVAFSGSATGGLHHRGWPVQRRQHRVRHRQDPAQLRGRRPAVGDPTGAGTLCACVREVRATGGRAALRNDPGSTRCAAPRAGALQLPMRRSSRRATSAVVIELRSTADEPLLAVNDEVGTAAARP